MPELPEVETVCRGLSPVLEGAIFQDVIVRQYKLRIPVPSNIREKLVSRRVVKVRRRAKYILIELDDSGVIIGHLGMSGRMTIYRTGEQIPPAGQHDHIDFRFTVGDLIRFSDPRRFGLITCTTAKKMNNHKLLRHLGPDPLDKDFCGMELAARLKGRKTLIKAALMDQRIVAGLGNIYVCESLYRAGISPKRKATTVQGNRAEKLVQAIRAVLIEALDAGGSSLRDHVQPNGKLGYFQNSFRVYGREGEACTDCDCNLVSTGGIKRLFQAGRSTFYCPRKQR